MATSIQDLKKATGVNESSLYNTFGNKEALFKEALARYRERVVANFASLPNFEEPKETLRTMLLRMARLAATRKGAVGCMMVNCAMELGDEYPEIARSAKSTYLEMEEWIFQTVVRGQELGELSLDHNPRALARYLTYNVQAMFAVARTSPSDEFMTDVVDTTFSVLQ